MHFLGDLKLHVHAPDGTSKSATAPADYKTDQFLKDIVGFFNLPVTADWSLRDADIERNLDKDKSLEENGVRQGHHLHLHKAPPDPGSGGVEPRPSGQIRAKISDSVDVTVGWLVATNGTAAGKDYKIRRGNNTIGRSQDMLICLPDDDDTISRNRHAVITFDSQTDSVHFRPGEGRNLVYVNGKAVFETVQLQPYDEILVGRTKMLFVPLCGDKFTWVKDAG